MDDPIRSRRRYAAAGALLAAGAPLGLLALDLVLPRRGLPRRTRAGVYVYVGLSTTVVFALFGWALGRAEDRRRVSQEQVGRLREAYAELIAHDLRDPIAALLLDLDALRRRAAGADAAPVPTVVLERLARVARHLDELVGQLLEAAELETARVRLQPIPVSLPATLRIVVERLRPALASHPIEILEGEAVLPVWADPLRLEQILGNLIDNAARYSGAGRRIRVRLSPERGGTLLSVIDEGVGIPAAEIPRLFDRYDRSARARRKGGGLGLGLYIAKGLVEAHGGRLWVESEPGRGSTFHVWLPTAPGLPGRGAEVAPG